MAVSSKAQPDAQKNERTAVALVGKITEKGMQISQQSRYNLQAAGLSETQVNQVLALAIAVGMDPVSLDRKENVAACIKAYTLVVEYSYVPGVDFYAVDYGRSDYKTGEKESSYAIVVSKDRLQENVMNLGRTTGVNYIIQKRLIVDPDMVNDLLDIYGPPGYIRDPGNRVCRARFLPVIGGQPMIGPDDGWEYGFALAKGFKAFKKDGGTYDAGADGKGVQYNANNMLADMATRRSIRKAAKAVAPGLIPADRSSVETRMERALNAARNLIEASDFGKRNRDTNENDVDDDESYDDRDLVELAASTGATAVVIQDETDPSPGSDLLHAIWNELSDDTIAWCQDLITASANDKKTSNDTTVAKIRQWVADISGWDITKEFEPGMSTVDIVLAMAFGTIIGSAPTVGSVQAFRDTTAQLSGKTWEIKDGSRGVVAIKEIATKIDQRIEEF